MTHGCVTRASFPEVAGVRLHDYKVRVLDGRDATAAGVRVLIESGMGSRRWSTVGFSTNIVEASWMALAEAFEYSILNAERHGAVGGEEPVAASA